ncbi:MAG: alpha/beta hydrolase [Polyangiales bacterium]
MSAPVVIDSQPIEVVGHGGLRLVGESRGDPAAPPVLLLHGGGQTRHAWDETAQVLAREGRRTIAVDLRGHGDSAWAADGDYTLDAFAEDIRIVARSLPTPPVIIGASLGGLTSMVAEAESPTRISSALVLVDIAPRMEPEGVAKIVGFMRASPDGFASLEEAADAIASYLPDRPRPTDLSGLAKNLRTGADGRLRWHWDPAFLGGRAPHRTSEVSRLTDAARALRIPTLLVRGRRSDLLSEQGVEEFLHLVPGARFVDVKDAGHMVAGDRNDAFTAAILPFLSEVSRPSVV